MCNLSDREVELVNEVFLVVVGSANTIFNHAGRPRRITQSDRDVELVVLTFQLVYNAIAIGLSGSWPWWSSRTIRLLLTALRRPLVGYFLRLLQAAAVESLRPWNSLHATYR